MIQQYGRSLMIGSLMGALLALVFFAGFVVRDGLDDSRITSIQFPGIANAPAGDYELLSQAQRLIEAHYLRPRPSDTQLEYGAIRGMLNALGDPNTFFIDPPVAANESDVLAGTYGGIGVTLYRNEQGIFLLYPFADSPAAQMGIRDGDRLVAVNGMMIELTTRQDEVERLLRGEVREGNGATVQIERGGEMMEQFIPFAVINVPSVVWRVLEEDRRIGYLQVIRFTNRTPDEVGEALEGLYTESVQGLVVDLRNNSGGLLFESIQVASYFLDDEVILYEVTREGERAFYTDPRDRLVELPVVILVNRGTASAAELVAGALKAHERAFLIGQRTFGKGTIQQILGLSDGSSLHITFAEWLTPDRQPLDGIGLIPDLEMIPDENGRDIELGEGLRYLRRLLPQINEEIVLYERR